MNINIINVGDTINNCTVLYTFMSGKKNLYVMVKCNQCGAEFKVPGYKFRRGHFMCKHGERRNADYYIGKYIGNLYVDNISGLDYDNRTLVHVICKNCGKEEDVPLHKVTTFGYICKCEKLDNFEDQMINKYKKYIGQKKLSDTIVDVVYRPEATAGSNRAKFVLHCNDCNTNREVGVLHFLESDNYKKCNCKPKTRETLDPVKRYRQIMLNKKFGSLTVVDFIEGNTIQNIYAICKCDCGNKHFETAVANILSGDTKSCGCKCRSYGSLIIEKALKHLNVNFTMEQQMQDLFGVKGRRLKFDFFILDKNNIGRAVIEYDGPHHKGMLIYGNKIYTDTEMNDVVNTITQNDKIKDEYVKSHGCLMLRIPYNYKDTDKDIVNKVTEFIISNKLNEI